jgi:hypothetical protein
LFGYINGFTDKLIDFAVYDDEGFALPEEEISLSDIVSIETNTVYCKYLERLISVSDHLDYEEKTVYQEDEILRTIYALYLNDKMAWFEILTDNFVSGYVVGYNKDLVIIMQVHPIYNVDEGIHYYPIKMVKSITYPFFAGVAYPYIYGHKKIEKKIHSSSDIKQLFLKRHLNSEKLISIQSQKDFDNEEMSVGVVKAIQDQKVILKGFGAFGNPLHDIIYPLDDLLIFAEGGFYLKKIEISIKQDIYKKMTEDKIFNLTSNELFPYLKQAQEKHDIVTLFSDSGSDISFESTGYIIDLVDDWLKMYLYDVYEDDWYYYYRSYKDFTGIRFGGYEELLASYLMK